MLFLYVAVVGLVVVLVLMNAHQAVARYMMDRDNAKLLVFLGPLLFLGYLFLLIAYRAIEILRIGDATMMP